MRVADVANVRRYVGNRIRAERIKRRMSQDTLARKAGLYSPFAVCQIENGTYECIRTVYDVLSALRINFLALTAEYANTLHQENWQSVHDELRKFYPPPSEARSA